MNLWKKISDIGVTPGLDSDEVRRIHIVNRLCALGIFFTLGFVPFLFLSGVEYYAPFQLAAGLLSCCSLLFTRKRKLQAAAIWLLLVINLNVFHVSLCVPGMGTKYFFIPLAFVPFATLRRQSMLVMMALPVIAFFAVEQLQEIVPPKVVLAGSAAQVNATVGSLAVFAVCLLIIHHFRRANEKYEEQLTQQKALIEERNKDITDSINYAQRLQKAILPPEESLHALLPDAFILYRPKDIVAGDFYWLRTSGERIFFAAADCTGHGVPGAMVSVVCSNALHHALKESGISEPGKILDKVRELVLETFEKSEDEVMDGMDIALISIGKKNNGAEIRYAGAHNPLWYVQQNELKEIAADKQPVGRTERSAPFSTHVLTLAKGDMLYLFTDGYADQFGGPKGKKFRKQQLKELLLRVHRLPAEAQKTELARTLDEWKGGLEQMDDVLIAGIRI